MPPRPKKQAFVEVLANCGFNPHNTRMWTRTLADPLVAAAQQMPVVTLTGPRQSGKTTLVRSAFPDLRYANLEAPDVRAHAIGDPRGFLGGFRGGGVLDEVQRAPELFSYIQAEVDEDGRPGRFILSGSQNFLLLDRISQTLAGRTSILHLHPFSLSELERRTPWAPSDFASLPNGDRTSHRRLAEVLHTGFYPRIHDRALDPTSWLEDYRTTYVERDVRQIVNVGDLDRFHGFLGLCAGRNGQLLNASSLGNDAGVDHTTVRRWLSVLEASFLVLLLRPHHRNFGKRIIRSPKLYFLDTGLLCSLLGVRTPEDLAVHASRGAIFESFVLSELVKAYVHRGRRPPVTFWRDSAGHEVDFLVEEGETLVAFEAKSGATIAGSFFDGLKRWRRLVGDDAAPVVLVHGGSDSHVHQGMLIRSWQTL
jgi:predicted AAA+ superfamily ATPase